jgi:hypothetical protein
MSGKSVTAKAAKGNSSPMLMATVKQTPSHFSGAADHPEIGMWPYLMAVASTTTLGGAQAMESAPSGKDSQT